MLVFDSYRFDNWTTKIAFIHIFWILFLVCWQIMTYYLKKTNNVIYVHICNIASYSAAYPFKLWISNDILVWWRFLMALAIAVLTPFYTYF